MCSQLKALCCHEAGHGALGDRKNNDPDNLLMLLQCQPTFISLFSYCAFWGIIFAILLIKWRRGGLTDADFKAKRRENKRRAALGLPPIKDMDELDAGEVPLPFDPFYLLPSVSVPCLCSVPALSTF